MDSPIATKRHRPNGHTPDVVAVTTSTTDLNVIKYSHKWTINNFTYCWLKPGEELNSSVFSSDIYDKIKWRMTLCPGGKNPLNKTHLALYLTLVSSYKTAIAVKAKFWIINDKGEKTNMCCISIPEMFLQRDDTDRPKHGFDCWLVRTFIENKINGLLPNDSLTILCEFTAATFMPDIPPSIDYGLEEVLLTSGDPKTFSYKWTIEQFTGSTEDRRTIESPMFSAETGTEFQWILSLDLREKSKDSNESSDGIFLNPKLSAAHLTSDSKMPDVKHGAKVSAKCSIIDSKNRKLHVVVAKKSGLCSENQTLDIEFGDWITVESLMNDEDNVLPEKTLTILCEITYEPFRDTNDVTPIKTRCTLVEDFENLFVTQKFSDVTLLVGERPLLAHRNILVTRSPVFAAMFNNDTVERRENRVNITDIDYEVLKEMVRFIYTGRAKNVSEMANALLMAADKYDLPGLKVICELEICEKINASNALETLILADTANADYVKARAIHFITANATEVMKTERFKEMHVSHAKLLAELVLRCSAMWNSSNV